MQGPGKRGPSGLPPTPAALGIRSVREALALGPLSSQAGLHLVPSSPITPSSPVCAGASLGVRAAGSEEPGSEGLPSTSLLDLLLPTGLEPLDSEEPSEAVGLGAGLGAPGSGFPSEESEESRILQPPQYFWEEEDALNESSLGLGPTAGSVPLAPVFRKLRVVVPWRAGSSWLCSGRLPSVLSLLASATAQCRVQALGTGAQQLWVPGSGVWPPRPPPRPAGSSRARAGPRVSRIGRWILNHWPTRDAPVSGDVC